MASPLFIFVVLLFGSHVAPSSCYDMRVQGELSAELGMHASKTPNASDIVTLGEAKAEIEALRALARGLAGIESKRADAAVGIHSDIAAEKATAVAEPACGDCYGARAGCCNSCAEVREAYDRRRWALPDIDSIAQCRRERAGGPGGGVCEDPTRDGGSEDAVPRCSSYLSCGVCVENGCGWCISQRACRVDEAWQCQGDVDHISLSGIGKHTQCPTQEEIDAERRARLDRIAAETRQGGGGSGRQGVKGKPDTSRIVIDVEGRMGLRSEFMGRYTHDKGSGATMNYKPVFERALPGKTHYLYGTNTGVWMITDDQAHMAKNLGFISSSAISDAAKGRLPVGLSFKVASESLDGWIEDGAITTTLVKTSE